MSTVYKSSSAVRDFAGKGKLIIFVVITSFFFFQSSAQTVNKDSLSLAQKIKSDQEKLDEMKRGLPDLEKQKIEAAEKAQQSANDNQKAATKLSDDPQDKKLARRAHSEASDARSDAKKARKASDRLTDRHSDIDKLSERIAKNQTKLNRIVEQARDEHPVVSASATDSLRH